MYYLKKLEKERRRKSFFDGEFDVSSYFMLRLHRYDRLEVDGWMNGWIVVDCVGRRLCGD